MKRWNKIIIFMLGIFAMFLFCVDVEAEQCIDRGCPCPSGMDNGYMKAEVKYKDINNQDVVRNLADWLNDGNVKNSDTGYATFYYNQNSQYSTGSRLETTRIKRTTKGANMSRGYSCPGSTYRSDLGIIIDDGDSEQEIEDTLSQYNCELFQSKRIYTDILQPVYIAIRVAIPALIVVLIAKDLVGAVVAQDEKEMQKVQKSMITRIIIGVIVLVLPTLVDAIMNLATITYGTCGIG